MLLLLIVIPCTLAGIGIVALLDRGGMLPRFDRPGSTSYKSPSSMVRPLSMIAIVILATWILAWLVVLVVGLNVIAGSS